MMRVLLSAVFVLFLASQVIAADLKSGPQVREKVPGPFKPLNVNGPAAGKKNCLYCEAGDSPTAAVFARDPDDPALEKLIVALDAAAVANEKADMYSFVVFCSNEPQLDSKLKALAQKCKLKKVVLAIDSEEGPEKYKINRNADVTILVYRDYLVNANHSYGKSQFTEKEIPTVLAEVDKLVK